MNEEGTPAVPAPGEPTAVDGRPIVGHTLPAAFGSPAMPTSFVAPAGPSPVFGGETQPTAPLPGAAEAASMPQFAYGTVPLHAPAAPEKKGRGGRVVALLAAAALVGGLAGFGTDALVDALQGPASVPTIVGPSAITVNNPGSVNETTAIATEVLPSTVTVQVASQTGTSGSGSGVILSADGYVLTNAHVATLGGADAAPTILVTTADGRLYDATIVGTDSMYDLAVLKLEDASGLTPIEFGDSSQLNVGDTTVAIGAPMGLANSVTTGIVSALDRSIRIASSAVPEGQDSGSAPQDGQGPFQFDMPGQSAPSSSSATISIAVIQTDAAINPGNSGGALVNSEGQLIGINVAIATAGSASGATAGSIGLGFAIPANVAHRIATEIIETGAASHGLLGATVQDARSLADAQVTGALIAETTPGGAAEAAGLREGDIVTQLNGAPISGPTDLTAQVRALAAGENATLTYVRDGRSATADVTLGALGS